MRVGAHVPTRGRLASAVEYALSIGADALQLFVSNPRAWAPPVIRADAAREFVQARREAGLGPVFVHSSYLVNVASPDPAFLRRSLDLVLREAETASTIEADGLVVHAGAGGPGERPAALERASASVRALTSEGDRTPILLELTAGGAGTVASTILQAAELLEGIGREPPVGLCLDTCHLMAAGYRLDEPDAAAACLAELRAHGLVRRLKLIHANDSRDPSGSRRDRHAHPGAGTIGEAGFRAILANPAVRRCPVLVETPGSREDHRRDVATLRRLAGV